MLNRIKYALYGATVAVALFSPALCQAEESKVGHLIIVGGGLRPDNAAIFDRLIKYAGGKERARIGVFPTASLNPTDAAQTKLILNRLGVPDDQAHVVDILPGNAERQAEHPEIVEQIRTCTGLFLEGGDQTRIMRALVRPDGSETAALVALREARQRGVVIGGTSAGAAVQCEAMISVAGLPDDTIDVGMDTLDFGLTSNHRQRGLYVSRGLELFRAGVIDQHFSQYRGRLGRLARVTVEKQIRYGFGIDENTALDVWPDGSIEVIGEGTVTIVDSSQARLEDGPLGCRMSGVRLSCLQAGDRFDPATTRTTPCEGKHPIVPGKEAFNGNFLIPDINGPRAALNGILEGLADNTATRQVGITLKHNQHHARGYRFTFQKTDTTESYDGYIGGLYSNTVLGVRLDIEPITGTLEAPEKRLPKDLPAPGPMRTILSAIWHRGILLADDDGRLRPAAGITRAELAGAIAQAICFEPPRTGTPRINDVAADAPFADDIALVVGNKFMDLDGEGCFHPTKVVLQQPEGAIALTMLASRFGRQQLPVRGLDHASDSLTRETVAAVIYKIVGFPWEAKSAGER